MRLTSSNFGKVMSRRPNNTSVSIVKNMLYNKFKGNIHTIRGLTQENKTIIEYKNMKGNVEVKETGLKICHLHPFLAASTDGIAIEKDKDKNWTYRNKKFLQTHTFLIKEATKKVKNFCLHESEGTLKLKKGNMKYITKFKDSSIYSKWSGVTLFLDEQIHMTFSLNEYTGIRTFGIMKCSQSYKNFTSNSSFQS